MTAPARLPRFAALDAPLEGIQAVESGAGTGKTTALTQLYLRLVLERGLSVDQILVVTFTDAATAELCDRVRGALARAQAFFSEAVSAGPPLPSDLDELMRGVRDRAADAAALRRRVELALRGFDEAAISTIHGFCARVLEEAAFESGMPFDTELEPDDGELLQEVVDDFYRREFYPASALFAAYLRQHRQTPETFREAIEDYTGRADVETLAPDVPPELSALEEDFAATYARAAQLFATERAEIVALVQSKVLSGTSYRPADLPKRLAALDDYFAAGAPSVVLPAQARFFTTSKLESAAKAGRAPAHPFFAAVEELSARAPRLRDGFARRVLAARRRLLLACRRELDARKRRLEIQSYDDLLLRVRDALAEPRSGARLAAHLRERHPAALIDEFQDTDSVQFDIFRRLYGDGSGTACVVFVGDPKQAIYGFRGADVFAFLAARSIAASRTSLRRNWRSEPELIEAVNHLFAQATDPFVLPEIEFERVEAAPAAPQQPRPRLLLEGRHEPPMQIWHLAREEGQARATKPSAIIRAAEATADEIARLLSLAKRGAATIGGEPVAASDIAVLVGTHWHGAAIRDALVERGIACIEHGTKSVFSTDDAAELERILLAAASPGDEALIRAALATTLLGADAATLDRLSQDDPAAALPAAAAEASSATWDEHVLRFQRYAERWRDHGFVRMLRQLLEDYGVAARLLRLRDGERRLTNLLHSAELVHTASVRERLGIEQLLRWLAHRRAATDNKSEEEKLRLESDENAVEISTVHNSKGLEFGIVFCPFVWDRRAPDGAKRAAADKQESDADGGPVAALCEPIRFHDRAAGNRPVIDFGSEGYAAHALEHGREELAEAVRLFYVALTRAKHRCTFVWGAVGEVQYSAPAWLLHQARGAASGSSSLEEFRAHVRRLGDAPIRTRLDALAASSGGSIAVSALPAPLELGAPPPAAAEAAEERRARTLARGLPKGWRVASFSSLLHAREPAPRDPEAEERDYDARPASEIPLEADAQAADRFVCFPTGRHAGRCLHAIFEDLDFATAALPLFGAALHELVARRLREHRFSADDWTLPVADAVRRVVTTPLDPAGTPRLADVARGSCLTELEFTYPVKHLDSDDLRRLLVAHGFAAGRLDRGAAALDFRATRGFMKGFVDLVFVAGGRFHILDYKSNHLGAGPDAYADDALAEEMQRNGYFLQYLIYGVALHRLLRLRLPGYDPKRHLGQVFYVFLRGVDGRPGRGTFRDALSPPLITALDAYLDGAAAAGAAKRAARGRRTSRSRATPPAGGEPERTR